MIPETWAEEILCTGFRLHGPHACALIGPGCNSGPVPDRTLSYDCIDAIECWGVADQFEDWFDFNQLAQCQSISGRLRLDSLLSGEDWLTTIGLPCLAAVGQNLSINTNEFLTTVSLPALEVVGGSLIIQDNNILTSLNMPELRLVGENMDIQRNEPLCESDVQELATSIEVRGQILVEDPPGLCF